MDNLDSFASNSAGTAPTGHRRDARQQQAGEQILLRGTAFLAYGGILPAHLLLAAVLLLGATFRDGFARFLQSLGAALLVLAAAAAPLAGPRLLPEAPGVLVTLYPLAAALVALAYGHLLRRWLYHLAALGSVTVSLIAGGWHAYLFLRPRMVGLDYVLGGLASLMVAGLISSLKAGLPQRWAARWKGRNAADLFEEEVKE